MSLAEQEHIEKRFIFILKIRVFSLHPPWLNKKEINVKEGPSINSNRAFSKGL